MTSAGPTTGNLIYQSANGQAQTAVDHGESLHEAIANAGSFSNLIIKMIAIEQQAGVLGTKLAKRAEHYDREVENAIDKILPQLKLAMMALLELLEPLVAGLITAMYLPVFKWVQC